MKQQKRMGIFWAVVLLSFFIGNHALAADAAAIKSFNPQGVVKGVRQATATFSEPMVPFGDPRLADPFTVQCPGKGQGRWIDSRTWSYDFTADLPGGVECEFRLQDGVKALSGADVSGRKEFRFSTGGPAVVRSVPFEGNERIDAGQIFVLYLDAAPREASLTGNVYFSVAGVKERVGITIVTGNERRKILKAINHKGDERLVVLVQARQAFPDATAVKLIWGRGVAAASGVATEKDQVLSFRTREPFRAEFSCTREKADRACIPILPLGLRFTAPIPAQIAAEIVITGPQGKKWRGKISDGDRRRGIVSYLAFPGPFPEKAELTLRLPDGIRDEAGRALANTDKFPLPVATDVYPPLAKFAARFGIIEAKGDRLLPVTIRNIERQLPGRLLKVDEKAPTPLVEPEEGTGAGAAQGEGSAPADENTGTGAGATPGAAKASAPGSPAFTGRLTGKVQRIGVDQDVKVIAWLRKIAAAEREAPILDRRAPSLNFPDRKQEKAFEVVGIPLPGPGFYIVELESRIMGAHLLDPPAPLFIPAAALTTDMAAHFKWGREYSLVWVTSLEKGTPVAGAAVVIRDCKGKALWQGKTDRTGVALIKTRLPHPDEVSRCSGKVNYREAPHALSNLGGGLFVFARSGADMTFTHSSWDEGIEPWRFQLPTGGYNGEEGVVAHTILDRPLFRAGETAHMKHILRTHTSGGFALLPAAKLPDTLAIQHLGSDQTYRLPLRRHANGSAETDWKIPENARLGTYELSLVKSKSPRDKTSGSERRWRSGSFRVEEFRVPLMKALIQAPVKPLVNVRGTPLDLSVSYLSGGGAALLPVRLRAEVQPKTITFKDYEDFSFNGGPLKEGIFPVSGRNGLEEGQEAAAAEDPANANKPFKLPTQELKLDNQGVLRAAIKGLPQFPAARDIHVEMEFRDPNGEIQTAAARIPLYPSRLAVGIRPDSWTAAQDNLNYRVAVVDLQGKPAPNVEATVDLYRQQTYSHRVRLVGGFYAYKSTREVKKIGRHCEGRTDGTGLLTCQGPSGVSGSVILRAEVRDETGLAAAANYDLWVAGKDDWWFEGGNDDRIDVLPEKKKYEPGDRAKFQVRMPFREATALVTVEREGILDIYIKKLSGKSPVVEIPVKKHYAPNVFVSVLAVRGRVGAGKPTATFDPGKPAYKLGVAEIRVGGRAHQLDVAVVPERTVYKVRDTMDVRIKVQGPQGRPLPKGGEVAVAAVDKGLLQLAPNDSWQLLKAMMQRRDYEVRTATAQAMVVGKRHFGQKAVSHGGGGGRQFTRELFDTLLCWQGRLTLDARGEATVRIPLNDSLTGFRIVAVATAGTGLFGTGEADVRTTQDLMILSGLPPLVREGDRYRAVFTVRNASDRDMKIAGRLTVRGGGAKEAQEQEPRREILSPGAAREISWWITVPPDTAALDYEATVKEEGGGAGSDRLKVTQKVVPAVPVRTVQAVLTQVRTPVAVPIEKPADAAAGRGGISVQVKPVLAASLSGVRDYMDHYAYTCLEQKVSRAVALKNKALWQAAMAQLPSYLDGDGLVKFFPVMRQGSDTLTAYVLAVAVEAGYGIPDYLRERMTAGLRKFVEGRVIRYGALPTADLAIRKLAAVEALSSYGQAEAKMLTSIPVDPNLWPTSALLDWINILRRVADIPRGEEQLKEGQQILRARMNLQGSRMTFATEGMDRLWWLMASADGNAVRSVLTLMNLEGWRDDLPRLAAGALGRMRRGHWDTTTANAWGVLAMDKFSARYEKTPVGGTTQAALNGKTRALDWQKAPTGGTLAFNWPADKETLQVTHSGPGAPWATVGATAALRIAKPFSSGFQVTRTVTKLADISDVTHVSAGTVEKERRSSHIASENKENANKYNVGDIVRVRLDMEAQSDMTWVVINDPIPAGASILRTGLGGDSLLHAAGEKTRGFAQEAFTERSQEAFRVYYEYVPKGKWSTEYTLRLNNEGVFQMPPSRLEALYAPEMFGETPVRPLTVTGKKQP